MPTKPENRHRYGAPTDWIELAITIKEEVGWKCEWCPAEQGKPNPKTGAKVVLTIAHLDHQPENCDRTNLKALCRTCRNTYDNAERKRGTEQRKKAAMREALGVMELPL